ncbi:MAG: helix-turn-helix domain-containing protein [Rhodanobacter sp.]|nr:MAG: helix-turn-helix domain-containing protein [Rhodanobacter sp.]TAM02427.1 MAG: helix-turn-helix domain-containing protein [Rhodanobacter sp.]TAM41088.1 MAG: helix-turn-helix domain-containing protein [Rhodanobacter sp.]TAN25924.1 MAG: helix-turn-helix domain-containing protein [Rhodanobacter sp.]
MMSIQSDIPEQAPSNPELFGDPPSDRNTASGETHQPSFGSRLCAAREARGLDLESCASTLKLPTRILRKLERDQHDGIDSKIYLGSYITTYGRYLGINDASIQVEVDRIRQIEAPLVATGGISHSRFLLDRYATAATYLVLTLVIAVPTVWFGVRSTLDRDLSHLAPLDATPVAQQDARGSSGQSVADNHALASPPPVATPVADSDQPLMASMAPFPNLSGDNSLVLAKPAATAVDAGRGSHSLGLTLTAASWVEVVQADGTRLEYGLLPTGTHKTYHSDQPLDVRIGNVSGAQVEIDGQSVGLEDFRHANVAHFRLQLQDGKASAAGL